MERRAAPCAQARGGRVLHSIAGIMRALGRIIVAAYAGLLFAGVPARAQVAPANSTTGAPTQNGVIGNPQLQGFSLNGTATTPAPTRVTPPSGAKPSPLPSSQAPKPQTPAPSRISETTPQPERQLPQSQAADLPPASPTVEAPSSTDASSVLGTPPEQAPFDTADTGIDTSTPSNPLTMLAWMAAGLALAGAAAWYFFRLRPWPSVAGGADLFEIAPQPLAKAPPSPAPTPAPASGPASSGIVSTRLRPWLEIEFKPDRGVVDEQKAAIAFELSVYNSGSMPARDVILEASLFNAGPMQDQQIQLFFDNPVARGDKIPVIPPMRRVTVNTAVFLAREQVVPIEMEGRALFVPMVALNALYSWGSSKGQTSASYLVGKETTGDKLAPFRLDLGPRIFRGLAARIHSVAVRK